MADRFHLRQDIQFHTRVESAVYNAADEMWTVSTDAGDRPVLHYGHRLPVIPKHA